MRKPIIGILGSILLMESGPFPGLERTYVNHDYIRAVELAGGIPMLLPVIEESEDIKRQLEGLDALILSGGYDLQPACYQEEPLQEMGFVWPEMDAHQLAAAKMALAGGKPMLGICRGMQIMNVAFGGSLYQDINSQTASRQQHVQKGRRQFASHAVEVTAGSLLAKIVGDGLLQTNSFHHQAVKDVAPGFVVSARAKDGTIEAIEKPGAWVLGLQWHPEMMAQDDATMLGVFKKLVCAVQ
ncbi:gamma-glutamyl-gamma-aminobutyrate hydrolase family protein [Azotosporobacter soli]|uniref:gamma-glutamyl-gamma-aminobutyrate hydrolase family protein n=1 Tax=Azotosporobacter soli TaxID=3055040 RepID=UPI0031FE4CC7